jgi:branched-chain amino acid transport system substrate-binding protein
MKHSKSIFIILMGVILIGSLVLINGCAKKEPETIKIGAILPLTGTAAEFGEDEQRGILLALEDINSKGGVNGHKIEVIFEDSKTEPKEAVTIFNKFLTKSPPPVILTAMSSVGMALKPLIKEHKIVMFIVAGNPALTEEGGYVFRMLQLHQIKQNVWLN